MRAYAVSKPIESNEETHQETTDSVWDHESALLAALREREQLLKDKPKLQVLQAQIDSRLSDTDTFEEKMKLIGSMLNASLVRLHEECIKLELICSQKGIDSGLPIETIEQTGTALKQLTENL